MAPHASSNVVKARDGAEASSGTGTPATQHVYVGVGVSIGILLFAAILAVVVKIFRKRIEHRRMMEALEVQNAVDIARARERHQEKDEPARPVSTIPRGPRLHFNTCDGWGTLNSNDSLNDPSRAAKTRYYPSIPIPKRLKKRGVPVRRKHLSAIVESPRSKSGLPQEASDQLLARLDLTLSPLRLSEVTSPVPAVDQHDIFAPLSIPPLRSRPTSATLGSLLDPSATSSSSPAKAPRSVSMGAFESATTPKRVRSHPFTLRSRSLSAPSYPPPTEPIPPLPTIQSHGEEPLRSALVQRLSSESQRSASSSVLVTSPGTLTKENKENVAPDNQDSSDSKAIAASDALIGTRSQHLTIPGVRMPLAESPVANAALHERDRSVHSEMARYCSSESLTKLSSRGSWVSTDGQEPQISVIKIATADKISISRVSPANSVNNSLSSRSKRSTPRGSPASSDISRNPSLQTNKTASVMREISTNIPSPRRQPSTATQASSCSSNGNPFQWDQPLQKPSALKGSPNARKKHRRQNCVRISTLTPQVLGPPPSRSNSPSITHGIEEEGLDGDEDEVLSTTRFVSNHKFSRPNSSASFDNSQRALRWSLSASTPNLAVGPMWPQSSPSQLSRSPSQHSYQSSASPLSLSGFPSPGRSVFPGPLTTSVLPEFYFTRPSSEMTRVGDNNCRPQRFSYGDIPSSPPTLSPLSKLMKEDSDLPSFSSPNSPTWRAAHSRRSSLSSVRPLRINSSVSPLRPRSSTASNLISLSAAESPTKASAAAMSQIHIALEAARPSGVAANIGQVDFPGAPILRPNGLFTSPQKTAPRRSASVSPASVRSSRHSRSNLSREIKIPSPLHIPRQSMSPQEIQKAQDHTLLRHAMALRRMNSDASQGHEARVYRRLGRDSRIDFGMTSSPSSQASDGFYNFSFPNKSSSSWAQTASARKQPRTVAGEDDLQRQFSSPSALDEESERFWKDSGSRSTFSPGSPPDLVLVKASSSFASLNTPLTGMTVARPEQNTPTKTPKSLYDSDGFLRT